MMLRSCYRPLERCFVGRLGCGCGGGGDGLLWHTDLKPHASGDYSIAVVQANSSLEDQSQVFTSPSATYVGVYDGHGGPEASRFVNKRLFPYMQSKILFNKTPINLCICLCFYLPTKRKKKKSLFVGGFCFDEASFGWYRRDREDLR
jgi:hypothetical protein